MKTMYLPLIFNT